MEEKINELISLHPRLSSIQFWEYRGLPESLRRYSTLKGVNPESVFYVNHWKLICEIDKIIEESSSIECLASSSQYIRECKAFFNKAIVKEPK